MEGSMKIVKYMLFAFNLLFAITGLILILTGGAIQGVYSEYLDFLDHRFFNAPVLLVVVGCVIFFVTFFGCCGAIKENHCMTMTFSILLALIFLVELAAGIGAYMTKDQVHRVVGSNMEKGLRNYGKPGYRGVTETWNVVQHELKCCGAQEYMDWKNTTYSAESNSVPDSCCLSDIEGCGQGVLATSENQVDKIIYTRGCLKKFEDLVQSNLTTVGGIGIGIALLQFVGILFACLLARTIKKEYETV